MHPIFIDPRRLAAYLAAWVPISVLVTALVALATEGRLSVVAALVMPLMLFYALPSLSAWYVCRAFPIQKGLLRVGTVHLIAAFVSASVWLLFGQGVATFMSKLPATRDAADIFGRAVPILFAAAMLLFWLSTSVSYLLIALENAQDREQVALEMQMLARESELKALTAQVHPHFLFNSLNSISALTASDAAAARAMAQQLAEFFRHSLSMRNQEMIPLSDEMSLVQSFLAIEQVRFGERLTVETTIAPDASECMIPPLLLQPLVENAVTHGIATLLEGGAVRIAGTLSGERLRLSVTNGYDPAERRKGSGGVGIANVRDRIALIWGDSAKMEIAKESGEHRVTIDVPAVRDGLSS